MLKDPEVDRKIMEKEVNDLAKYDKQFNETYKAFLDHEDDSFVVPDDEIIAIKESLTWK